MASSHRASFPPPTERQSPRESNRSPRERNRVKTEIDGQANALETETETEEEEDVTSYYQSVKSSSTKSQRKHNFPLLLHNDNVSSSTEFDSLQERMKHNISHAAEAKTPSVHVSQATRRLPSTKICRNRLTDQGTSFTFLTPFVHLSLVCSRHPGSGSVSGELQSIRLDEPLKTQEPGAQRIQPVHRPGTRTKSGKHEEIPDLLVMRADSGSAPAALQAPPLARCSPHVPVGVNESDPTTCCCCFTVGK
ncbi:unnamed protein product [Pleuronectes platessa]|uniref:Uncharacterized protein n=1 Tax=Pleuronectes platessa TaxID=8262 RepID=A0A9N7TIZ2_PLEPL|nr:unnamed protein product [Pleuronectes platessa]